MPELQSFLATRLAEAASAITALGETAASEAIAEAVLVIETAMRADGRLLVLGNGGSAADAAHLAGEFVGRCVGERRPLPALALTEPAVLTALGNDYGFEQVFARQVRALGRPGDVVLALSTSGRSPNVLAALAAAREGGMTTIGMTGSSPGAMAGLCDVLLLAPATSTPRVQECHQVWGHLMAEWVDACLAD